MALVSCQVVMVLEIPPQDVGKGSAAEYSFLKMAIDTIDT